MILKKDILVSGHPTLSKAAKNVELPISEKDKMALFKMYEHVKMSQNDELAKKFNIQPAVGIAAPQIGISKRMFVMHTSDEDGNMHSHMFINPSITSFSLEKSFLMSGEGCLSVVKPHQGIVPRYKKIRVSTHELLQNGMLRQANYEFDGFASIVFQHEYDHLDGILFTDKITQEIKNHLIPIQ